MGQTQIVESECSYRRTHEHAAYPLVSSCDVLQRSGGGLAGGEVDLTLLQHTVVHRHYLWVPQPLYTLWHPRDLGESGEILVFSLSGERMIQEDSVEMDALVHAHKMLKG